MQELQKAEKDEFTEYINSIHNSTTRCASIVLQVSLNDKQAIMVIYCL